MKHKIEYIDPTGSMTSSNNPTTYDYEVEGIIPLSTPSLISGEFRGWYTNSEFSTRINQLDDSITSDITIYAYVQTITQLQILGSSITEIQDLSSEPYLLFTNRIESGKNRSLLAMTPTSFSNQVNGAVSYIRSVTGHIETDLNAVRQEYFIDVGSFDHIDISMSDISSAKYLIFHFTRGTDNTLSNFNINVTFSGVTIRESGTNSYSVTLGSSIIFIKHDNEWIYNVYMNPELNQVIPELTDSVLSIRNYATSGNLDFTPENTNIYGGRKYIDIVLDLDLSGFSDNIIYKSVFVQFNTSAYDGASESDIVILNNKQGYLNLIGVQPATLVYNRMNNTSVLRLTYDYIPAYASETLHDYTQNIPVKIMVVI